MRIHKKQIQKIRVSQCGNASTDQLSIFAEQKEHASERGCGVEVEEKQQTTLPLA